MGLTRSAITRPVFILMLMIAAVLMGNIAKRSMRLELNPEVNFPIVTVNTTYRGADPDTISTLVSKRIEDSVSGVTNLRELTSTSQEGVSTVVATFELGTDVNVALDDVRTRVDAVVNQLPTDADRPTVLKLDNSAQPVLYLAFASSTRNSQELRDLIDDRLKDQFGQIKGVAQTTVQGGDVREIQIQLNKDRLLSYGLGITDVARQIANGTQNVPGGRLIAGDREYTVRVLGEWKSIDQIRNSILTVSDPNSPQSKSKSVRIGDIATVSDTVQERTAYSRLNKSDTVVLAIQKAREGNAVEITESADKLIKTIQGQYSDLKIVKTLEQAKQITDSLDDLYFTLYFAIALVAAVVYLFLHNFRGTLIVAIAIPVCIFAAFCAMSLAGFTINNLTMLALILAVGVLVDDAIVVLENIYRHLRMGEDPRDAALNGRGEIGLAALAITAADVVVFLPIGFMGGIVGQFFKPLAFTYVFAVLTSLFVSFTVTPMLASRWYKAGEDMEHPHGRFAVWFEKSFGKLEHGYRNALEWSLNHRWFVFILGNSALVAIVMFIAGGFKGLGANSTPDPKLTGAAKYIDSIWQAASAGVPLVFVAVFFGIITFVVNFLRNYGNPKQGLIYVLGSIGISIGLVAAMAAKAPVPAPVLGFALSFMILFIATLAMNFLGQKRSKLRYVGNGLLFGLLFPVAAAIGGVFGIWKASAPFKFEFIPSSDNAQVGINVKLPPDASLETTQRIVSRIEEIVSKNPNVKYVLSNVGTQGVGQFSGAGNSGSNYAQVLASLYDKGATLDRLPWKHSAERLRWISDTAVSAQILEAVGKVPGADIKVSTVNAQGFGSPIQLSFRGSDRDLIIKTATTIRSKLQQGAIPGVINADLSTTPGKPELQAIPDRERLADAGLTVSDIGAAQRTLYSGDEAARFRTSGKEYKIRTQLSPEDKNNPDIVNEVPVGFKGGSPIFLGSVTKIQTRPAVDKVQRRDREQEVQLTADLLPGFAAGTIQSQIDAWLLKENLVPVGVKIKPLGQADAQARESGFLIGAFGLGLVLVYMLLASLYDNLLYPFIIQIAQPQAMTGALLALVLTDKSFNLIGFIGLITLTGLVGKNAILLVDYTNTLRDRGRNRHDAIVEAGPIRLRPIAMTTLALILGTMPIALALGRGSEFRETIGIVIIGGISLSTLLTLLVIPCSYTIFDDLSIMIAHLMGHRAQHEAPTDAGDTNLPPAATLPTASDEDAQRLPLA